MKSLSQLLILVSMIIGHQALAAATQKNIDANQDIDSLGGNQSLMQMAQALDPDNRTRIVQKRLVDRHNRLEMGVSWGAIAGGDTYLQTQSLGVNLDYHINPKFAIGVRYNNYGNDLSPEGHRMFDEYRNNTGNGYGGQFPDIDPPQWSGLGLLEWFPIYGKINLFESSIVQFDMYLLGGGGVMNLATEGNETMYTAGGGAGIWLSNRWTMRFEARWQNYHDHVMDNTGTTTVRTINETLGTVGMGFLI